MTAGLNERLGEASAGEISVEVSSPGAERQLRLPDELERFQASGVIFSSILWFLLCYVAFLPAACCGLGVSRSGASCACCAIAPNSPTSIGVHSQAIPFYPID